MEHATTYPNCWPPEPNPRGKVADRARVRIPALQTAQAPRDLQPSPQNPPSPCTHLVLRCQGTMIGRTCHVHTGKSNMSIFMSHIQAPVFAPAINIDQRVALEDHRHGSVSQRRRYSWAECRATRQVQHSSSAKF
ncbi:hypothetical protein BS50DRAFT_218873 [Corynespora cassiicola Philippines]|uniref:Uncharacterized protein n=1 Tax=Corynespora cassiicola Philippines TaxID=1448308 RepID=A0A2T2N3Z4_CORCC|nr:hypothetical protein BS50DRAFT_218873 [Corynespora cassiicola Philippines]